MLDSAIGQLAHAGNWTRGDDVSAASVDDVIEAFNVMIETAYQRGCHMVGEIIELATSTVPDWALECDGAEYLRADYPELVAVLSPTFFTDSTHFRVPDRDHRFGLYGPPLAFQGGEAEHTLITAEIPAHAHTDLGHDHAYTSPFGEFLALGPGEEPVVLSGVPAVTATGSANIQNTGGGDPHNNMPPWEGTMIVIVARSHD
jgi:microcystin-dependent protein